MHWPGFTPRRPGHPRGFALLIVLWSVVLLSLLATGITAAGRTDMQLAGNIRRAAITQAAAEAGIATAIFHMSDAAGRSWPADGSAHTIPFGAYRLTVRVLDEARKVNPNAASVELMAAVIIAADGAIGVARAGILARAIADWHQPGIEQQQAARYRAAGLTAAPLGSQFRSVDELGLVIGMTPAVLDRLRPLFSVYAQPPLDLDHADPVVRAAVSRLGTPPVVAARPSVVEIVVEALGPDGSRAERRAVVALGPDGTGRLFRRLE